MAAFLMSETERKFAKKYKIANCLISEKNLPMAVLSALQAPILGEKRLCGKDEIITASSLSKEIADAGFTPVEIPFSADANLPDISFLEKALSPRTAAVFLPHGAGKPYDLKFVRNFCNCYELWMIEDARTAPHVLYDYNGNFYFTGTVGDLGIGAEQGRNLLFARDKNLALLLRQFT